MEGFPEKVGLPDREDVHRQENAQLEWSTT